MYNFKPTEPSVFVELYLPKKSSYQGTLYKLLTEGFDIQKVRDHLKTRKENIQEFLQDSQVSKYSDRDVEEMSHLFYGYSMYEVDGVFWDEEEGRNVKTYEERVQVIRLIFRPIKSILKQINEKEAEHRNISRCVREFLNLCASEREERKKDEISYMNKELREKIWKYMEKWEKDVQIFLFGYVVFGLSDSMEKNQNQQEEEIWITSFWNCELNRVVKNNNITT